ncbi:thioredoxin 1 [Bradyrhizobium sp. USDA 4524]|uniref:thioredoxin family protein n=1 Tax=Bradyrhizobium TaxID=374 RepID=UPI0020A08C96|nr:MULTISPECIES: thioredoxin family protein [Bradyrhizobium]MCP1840157.1 thiol-disulfide isomerase/thioredoxin [Bradyrhizobium sp. USDA 4538]MCP1900720.1 thiol-disulfide isomerase/thioredoxin [Bradyrhizobium sp. USDA 4537]MCP1993624.1 thiol-disulfide isomerase/thioredoxin [Bradyrhizobium sp. USDA 4539]MCP3416884.1 thioredoxin family protein [Bradyrhizobium brasilense]
MHFTRMMAVAVLALGLSAGIGSAAFAATEVPFTQQAFDAAQHQGKPILVHITAPWCPYCAKQRPILSSLENEAAFKDLVVYNVDFDTQKDIVRAMGAQKQSTLIVFHGAAEKGRSTGDTDANSVKTLLEKAND